MRKTNHKTHNKYHPAYVTGIVSFEFWNNNDEAYRNKTLKDLAKEARKSINISVISLFPENNLEAGELAFAGIASSRDDAEILAKVIMEFLESHAPARIINDNWVVEELPF